MKDGRVKRLIVTALVLSFLFVAAVPVSGASIVHKGQCGDHVTWTLDSDGLLTLKGYGPTWDYEQKINSKWDGKNGFQIYGLADWYYCGDKVRRVVIEDGITTVGNDLFAFSPDLESVVLPDSITRLGDESFIGCDALVSISFPENVEIGKYAFYNVDLLKTIYIPSGAKVGFQCFMLSQGIETVYIGRDA
ncbi:MAG: leucine-rich repeat domain-containing protein, partial [Firmicutes bacterium]|nr:leucine-rich repeat domain-containing protein [Bacillota bacterium]